MSDGYNIVYSVALATLKMHESILMGVPFEKIMEALREFEQEPIDPDKFMAMVEKMDVPMKKIAKYEKEYQEQFKMVNSLSSSTEEKKDKKDKKKEKEKKEKDKDKEKKEKKEKDKDKEKSSKKSK